MPDIEHSNIPDNQRHELKGASTAILDQIPKSNGDGTTSWVNSNSLFNAASFTVENIFDSSSVAATQEPSPSSVDTVRKIEFGPAVNGLADPVMLDSTGTITFNEPGLYIAKIAVQLARSGASGSSIIHFRAVTNSTSQGANTVTETLDNASSNKSFHDLTMFNIPIAGTTIHYEFYRDLAGDNSGHLEAITPSLAGVSPLDWNVAPSASIEIERFVAT